MGVPPAAAQLSYPSAPPLVQPSHNQRLAQVPEQQAPKQPQHSGGYPPAVQGMGVPPAAVQPSYPSAPPLVQPSHNQRWEQVPEQPAPKQPAPEKQAPAAAAAEESAVKRGKRKAVDLDDDDAPPRKKQMIHPLLYHPDFELVESHGEARYKCCLTQCENAPSVRQADIQGHIRSKRHQKVRFISPGRDEAVTRVDSSNIGGSFSKNQPEAGEVSQRPSEGFTSSQPLEHFSNNVEESANPTSSEPLEEPFNYFDETVDPAWDDQVEEWFSIINQAAESTSGKQLENSANTLEETADSASGEQLEEVVINLEETADSAAGEQLEGFVNSLDGTDASAPDDLFEYCMNNWDLAYKEAPGEPSLEELINCLVASNYEFIAI
ncbi:hypothetical protein F4604DRAFT_1811901 [Suillus subluteus]|nr:hypothetical protein F4604DRAFT_1811901 [Suillus subluteus]